ncbi:hypothetical protein [Kordia sp.]|uniref:hypothetical protein n=1 Tax=Kordia sp. TaxID=1965332 RepID=UPI0025B85948|nr:hypothetical protein [Kordia sp.]MCH2196927.1 hypothetical protein [Kordia sp.]
MNARWCKENLKETVAIYGKSEIINTVQGSQLTSEVFAKFVLGSEINLSVHGK